MNYYGTTTNGFSIPEEVGIRFGLKSTHSQYRLVIKAKSRAAANRRWKEITGRDGDIFLPNYTAETGNKLELEMCDKYGEVLSRTSGVREYSDLKDVVKAIRESNRKVRDDKMIKVMYLIFDYLYDSKEYAESLEDGKEDARKVYCFINTEDKDEKELDSTQGVEVYDTSEEAEEVLKEWYEEV